MTPEKIREVAALYRTLLTGMDVTPKCCDTAKLHGELKNPEASLSHCLYMLEKMDSFIDEGRIEKALRWLGYAQCALYYEDLSSIDQFKEDNRPD